jgi:hypothetical protein
MIYLLQLIKKTKSDYDIEYFLKCKLQQRQLPNYNFEDTPVATTNDTMVATRKKLSICNS